jgi:hypothetical protein
MRNLWVGWSGGAALAMPNADASAAARVMILYMKAPFAFSIVDEKSTYRH